MQNLDNTLFLDRDGVINRCIVGDYVRNISQLEFLPGAIDAIVELGKQFRYVIVVTNQQGIGKGLMSEADVSEIHEYIIKKVKIAGGRIDKIYYCPSLKSANDPQRKPGIGMGLQAKLDFPDIDFTRSLMIGDSESDMLFAEKLGMPRILIDSGDSFAENTMLVCKSLADTCVFFQKNAKKFFFLKKILFLCHQNS